MRANDLKARSIDLRTGLKYPPEPRGCLNSFALRLAATTGMIAVDAMTVIATETAADEIEAARPDARRTSRRLLHHRHPRDATDVNRIAGHFRRNFEKKCFVCKDCIVCINFLANLFQIYFSLVIIISGRIFMDN